MEGLFAKIIKGEIPSYKLGEDEHCFSFLDIKPLARGHALVIPKIEIDYIFDVPDDLLIKLSLFSKRMAIAIKQIVPCTKVGMSVVGLEVPHAHIHLVPLKAISDLNFSNPRIEMNPEEFSTLADRISKVFNQA